MLRIGWLYPQSVSAGLLSAASGAGVAAASTNPPPPRISTKHIYVLSSARMTPSPAPTLAKRQPDPLGTGGGLAVGEQVHGMGPLTATEETCPSGFGPVLANTLLFRPLCGQSRSVHSFRIVSCQNHHGMQWTQVANLTTEQKTFRASPNRELDHSCQGAAPDSLQIAPLCSCGGPPWLLAAPPGLTCSSHPAPARARPTARQTSAGPPSGIHRDYPPARALPRPSYQAISVMGPAERI